MSLHAYEYFISGTGWESSGLGDGSGWHEDFTDWVCVEASSWREARTLGRIKVEEEYPRGAIYDNRRDGLYPFRGEHCRLMLMMEVAAGLTKGGDVKVELNVREDSPLGRQRAAEAEVKRLADELHKRACHPDYEYEVTTCGRKAGPAPMPEGDGWELNTLSDDPHSSWERFEYHEEVRWRRRLAAGSESGSELGLEQR